MPVRTTTSPVAGSARPKPERSMGIWIRWLTSRRPPVEPELDHRLLEHEPDRIFQLPAGIK
jgi:hypothetical protein